MKEEEHQKSTFTVFTPLLSFRAVDSAFKN